MLKSWLLLALVACATVVDVSASQVDAVDAIVAPYRKLLETAEDAGKPDEDEPMMGTGEGEMSILVVEEDDKTDGEVEGTGGDDEMSITGGGDEEGDKADEVGDSSDDGEMHILETNSTVVAPNGTKPCEDEMCIQETMPHCFPQSAGEAKCESHNYTAAQCADPTVTQGCCEYDDGECSWNPKANPEIAAAVRALNEAPGSAVSPPPPSSALPPISGAVHGRAAAALGVAFIAAAAAVFAA